MHRNIQKHIKAAFLVSLLGVMAMSVLLTSCDEDDDAEATAVELLSFGPMPILRGAELSFIGHNLDQVTSVILPDDIEITASEFTMVSKTKLMVTVPQNAVEGLVQLVTKDNILTTKTPIGYNEPISIETLSPTPVKPGSVLTISGDYLNLVAGVIFTDRVQMDSTNFISQSRKELTLMVPAKAQTGKIALTNGAENPTIIYSETDLTVILPVISEISPNPVKAGMPITVKGTNLDLVMSISLGGEKSVSDFTVQSKTEITFSVPRDAQDGKLALVQASMVEVESLADLVMVIPTVSVSPTSIKNGNSIVVAGTDLDLIDKVVFGGNMEGIINDGGTSTSISVMVPEAATTGEVLFTTSSNKTVSGGELSIISPEITSITPLSGKPNTDLTVTGTDLDVVSRVMFTGGIEGSISAQSETELTITIPVGAQTGQMTLVALNGTEVVSSETVEILSNLPDFESFSEAKGTPGQILTINGTKLDLIKELIFPDGLTATAYGIKTDTKIEVYVPMDAASGMIQISMVTYEGEEGLLPELYIGGTDPVADPSLIINDFDEEGHDLGWDNWGGNVELGSDPEFALSGKYMHGIATELTAWAWIWGCNHDQLKKVSVTKADHVLKMDINLTKPFNATDIHFQMELAGSRIDIGGFGLTSADETTIGWITVTYDLSQFDELPDLIPDSGEWGLNFGWATGAVDLSGLYLDNIRFELK